MLRENIAGLCHLQWSNWMRYLFSKGTFNHDGTWTMPAWAVERWTRQTETPYIDLPESEKDSDRKEADKLLQILGDNRDLVFAETPYNGKRTTDQDLRAKLTRALYWLLNLWPRPCRKMGYNCEWFYPYGWVAEAGCPIHD